MHWPRIQFNETTTAFVSLYPAKQALAASTMFGGGLKRICEGAISTPNMEPIHDSLGLLHRFGFGSNLSGFVRQKSALVRATASQPNWNSRLSGFSIDSSA